VELSKLIGLEWKLNFKLAWEFRSGCSYITLTKLGSLGWLDCGNVLCAWCHFQVL